MNSTCFRSCALATALMLAFSPSMAEQSQMMAVSDVSAAQSSVTSANVSAVTPANKTFSQQELDQLLAPIALYADALLAQVFMGSTYPLEVVEASRWVKANPKVTGKALEDAMAQKTWDPSVKSLTAVPQVLQQRC